MRPHAPPGHSDETVQPCPLFAPLMQRQTIVMPAMNGVPWWFLKTLPTATAPADRQLASIDPDGRLAAALPLERVLGCVVHLTCTSPEPGLIRHGFGERLIVGEPAGGPSARTDAVCAALAQAGFQAEASVDIRHDIWFKLWGNMTMNPISAFTGATVDRIVGDDLVSGYCLAMMKEAAAVGTAIGCPITQSGEERIDVARKLGVFKTSMLQDVEAGKPLEIDVLLTVVREIAGHVAIATPHLDALLGLTRLFARTRGLYPA